MKPAIIRPDLELKKEIREVPARNVIYIRLFGDYKMNDYGGTWMRLFQFIKEENCRWVTWLLIACTTMIPK